VRSLVIYATRTGNTERVAAALATGLHELGEVQVLSVADAPAPLPANVDLLVVGGPTEGHGATEAILALFEEMEPDALDGVLAAAFDTRMRWPRLLSGSAAVRIAERLRQRKANVIVEPESFFVHGRAPELEPGELERATAWAGTLAERTEHTRPRLTPA